MHKLFLLPVLAVSLCAAAVTSPFTWSGYTWNAHGGGAPGNVNGNVGTLNTNNVAVNSGALVLTMTQTKSGTSILSDGAEVGSTLSFSYGTFEFTSRVSNVVTGHVASGFVYGTNSITEIDMEQLGDHPDEVNCTNWNTAANEDYSAVTGYNQGNDHDFVIVWQPTYVDWYVDGVRVAHHTKVAALPTTPSPMLFNLWGTNNTGWGGLASPGQTVVMTISSFKYTPGLKAAPPSASGVWK